MVRYIALQGFTDATILTELQNLNASASCIFNVQFLRQRITPPPKLSNLLWIREPFENSIVLRKFWVDANSFVDASSKQPRTQLCPLALQVKYDVTEHTTRKDYIAAAKEAGASLAMLFFQLVKAKTLFHFYNSSLLLQKVSLPKDRQQEPLSSIFLNDLSDFMANLGERYHEKLYHRPTSISPAVSQLGEASNSVKNISNELETLFYQRGVLSMHNSQGGTAVPFVDSRNAIQQRPRTEEQ